MPLAYLIILFIGIPVAELAILIKLHDIMGLGATILLVLLTGIIGAALVRRQGINLLFKIQQEMAAGNLPAPQMIDGIMILLAGAFLITPGLMTDTVGFALLVPFIRAGIRGWLRNVLERKLRNGTIHVNIRPPYE
ncbi:MAG: FxsA family protein [Pontiellaceae bacterium]|nr:FxsA family protein [Pontiellaceae bacterium]MBN2784674.1 FxsA family protein [Pontiellaceae bacterium]